MGDVFVILSLLYFGPAAALLTYWVDNVVAHFSDIIRKHGIQALRRIPLDRFFFNMSCCSLSVAAMYGGLVSIRYLALAPSLTTLLELAVIAFAWFAVNTVALSLAIAFKFGRGFWAVWSEGLSLYVFNFAGSAAAAGLIKGFHNRVETSVFFLSIPIAVVLLQLYRFYISKYEQAQAHISDLNKLFLQTVETLAAAVDAKDRYTHGHIRRVQTFALELAKCMGITDTSQLMGIQAGALLHDIGKIAIPEFILNKPSALTDSEYAKMRLHPVVGSNMLKNIEFPYDVVPIVRSHHERWDGNGYPDGLAAEEIPIGARILALVDCYDALTTDRPYRSPMARKELTEFLRSESGRAYDPRIVEALISNLDQIEAAGSRANAKTIDIWGIGGAEVSSSRGVRSLQKVLPIETYSNALAGDSTMQAQLFSTFEFARANIQCLSNADVLAFMGRKLEELVAFDGAAFFLADLERGVVVAEWVLGTRAAELKGLTLPLEKKLTGWVASNNQALCNLPPFPDFIDSPQIQRAFSISAIAPMNRNGMIWGAISVYRVTDTKFSEKEFRHLEILASQTALALSNCSSRHGGGVLVDGSTSLPNGYHLHLMFDQLASDAQKFDYPFALMVFRVEERRIRRRWGFSVGEEAIRSIALWLRKELRDDDLLVRYSSDEFVAIIPRVDRAEAEGLKTRLESDFSMFHLPAGFQGNITLPLGIGVALFPEDGMDLEGIVGIAHWQLRRDISESKHQGSLRVPRG
jgi:diguanylate cyclase (GGDEF)-like protein/putative nucleotidyltransferase with HDIG domain